MFRFQYLKVWKKSFDINKQIIYLANQLPPRYRYSLTEQLIRATLSISNNIAEGSGRSTKKDQNYFYAIAKGSTFEVVNMILLIKELNLWEPKYIIELEENITELSKMLYGLMKSNQ